MQRFDGIISTSVRTMAPFSNIAVSASHSHQKENRHDDLVDFSKKSS